MDNFTYSKYKENTPEQTVARIKSILERLDLKTKENWIDSGLDCCYTVRVTLEDTGKGANGKGTSREYCLASGYAELMERLQPDFVYIGAYNTLVESYGGFDRFPDETRVTPEELAKIDSSFSRFLYQKYMCIFDGMKESLMKVFIEKAIQKDTTGLVPFINAKTGETEPIPFEIAKCLYGSNGMCAGNTPEEALVQGLSEIFERRVMEAIIHDNMVPPNVPKEYLQKHPVLFELIESMEAGGRYKVEIKDCSMGGQYPCVACLITDTENGTFGFKMGAHPSFAVALERTFTEAMQGKTLEAFASINRIADKSIVSSRDNLLNLIKTGNGYFHPEIYTAEPSYPFVAFKDTTGKSNRDLLADMLTILTEQGLDVLIRDVSYFGFPSYIIIVPGFSEIYAADQTFLKALVTASRLQDDLSFSTSEARERLIRHILFKRYSIMENEIPWILQRPFNNPIIKSVSDTEYLLLAALFDNGHAERALEQANYLAGITAGEERLFFTCAAQYLFYSQKRSAESAALLIKKLYKDELADEVIRVFGEPGGAIKAVLPSFPCWDCENCNLPCEYPELSGILIKLKKARMESGLTQDGLHALIRELVC